MFRSICFVFCLLAAPIWAQEMPAPEEAMTWERLTRIVQALDADTVQQGPTLQFTIADIPLMIVADPVADRMRALVPIASAQGLSAEDLLRLMQANFDTALDARYAVAGGRLWGVFIHPLASLEKDQLLSALAQTVNVARTYGQTYSGGAHVFGGGDSGEIYRDLLGSLRKKGQEL